MGADVCINSKNKDLREEIMKLTDGNGVARLVEASGFSPVVNSCFALLRKVIYAIKCSSFLALSYTNLTQPISLVYNQDQPVVLFQLAHFRQTDYSK